ncbi:MAG: DNA polymerase III subunit epsilon [Maricaulaceae bacterium]|jgi:DNA polymerase-3 subunit epsilon
MREIVLDTETTGLDPQSGDRITEIGCIEVIDCIPTGRTFHTYVNPLRPVPREVVEITGLTTEFLADKPTFAEIAEGFITFVGEARCVAHNAPFDRGFVNSELSRATLAEIVDERWLDTLELAREMFPGAQTSLDALCRRFNISLERRDKHGALIDAELLAEVYLQLNGGRERSLDFGEKGAAGAGAAAAAPRNQRPSALGSLVSAEEAEAHAAFVTSLGENALWRRYEE